MLTRGASRIAWRGRARTVAAAGAFAGLVALAACDDGVLGRATQDPGWSDGVRLAEVVDLDPDPRTIEINLEARPFDLPILPAVDVLGNVGSLSTPVWNYNGTTPGPLIRANVGDRLVVHFLNSLPENSSVHWHGIRLPAAMDGVPGHTQPPVPPGGTFDYSFVLPDAGLFWYHPHADAATQVGYGLYGPLLVEDPGAPRDLGDEVVLVLSDIGINADGSLAAPTDDSDTHAVLMGQEGNTLLVNGRVRPTLGARSGLRQRWRIVNSAKSRYFQLSLAGHQFTRIGGDGGFLQAPEAPADSILIIPAGRADVLVTPVGNPGDILAVHWVPYDRGFGTTWDGGEQELFYVKISASPAAADRPIPATLRTIAPIDTTAAIPRSISLTIDTSSGKVVLGINGVPAWLAPPLPAAANTTELWTIRNTVSFDHPFHLHGFFFQPLDPFGVSLPSPEWKDTVNIPALSTVKFAVRYDDRLGMWMFHCHILDHSDAGMMGMLLLE